MARETGLREPDPDAWKEIKYPEDYIPVDTDPHYYQATPDGVWHLKDGDGLVTSVLGASDHAYRRRCLTKERSLDGS